MRGLVMGLVWADRKLLSPFGKTAREFVDRFLLAALVEMTVEESRNEKRNR